MKSYYYKIIKDGNWLNCEVLIDGFWVIYGVGFTEQAAINEAIKAFKSFENIKAILIKQ